MGFGTGKVVACVDEQDVESGAGSGGVGVDGHVGDVVGEEAEGG